MCLLFLSVFPMRHYTFLICLVKSSYISDLLFCILNIFILLVLYLPSQRCYLYIESFLSYVIFTSSLVLSILAFFFFTHYDCVNFFLIHPLLFCSSLFFNLSNMSVMEFIYFYFFSLYSVFSSHSDFLII